MRCKKKLRWKLENIAYRQHQATTPRVHSIRNGGEITDYAPSSRVTQLPRFKPRYVNLAISSECDMSQRQHYSMQKTTLKRVREFSCHAHFQRSLHQIGLHPIQSERPRAVTTSSTFQEEGRPACSIWGPASPDHVNCHRSVLDRGATPWRLLPSPCSREKLSRV